MKLIVGLGNPGKEYENTRHNIGFMVLDNYAKKHNMIIDKKKFNSFYQKGIINTQEVILVKPATYMNLSGEAIIKFVNYFKININDILIVYDDLDLECGKFRLRSKGRSGGHNGIKSIIKYLGTDEFKRLKIGISNDKLIDTKDYVLGKITSNQKEKLVDVINKTSDIIDDFLSLPFSKLTNKYNRK